MAVTRPLPETPDEAARARPNTRTQIETKARERAHVRYSAKADAHQPSLGRSVQTSGMGNGASKALP